jgi:protein-disulfide isomerase
MSRPPCPPSWPSIARLLAAALLLGAVAACGRHQPSAEERLARLERRLDKLTRALEQALPPPPPDPAEVYAVALAEDDLVDGPADARLTLVEGFEFACPYCFAAQPLLEELRARHPADLRIVSKYYLVHGAPAVPAGLAVCAAAKQGKGATVKRALWRKVFAAAPGAGDGAAEPELVPTELTASAVLATAVEAGADRAQLERDMQGAACADWVRAGGPALERVGAAGTPAFYLNGRAMATLDLESAEALIAEELARADRAIAGGLSAAQYYRTAVVERGRSEVRGRFDD